MSLPSWVGWVSVGAICAMSSAATGCSSTTTSGGPEDSGTNPVGDTGSTGIHDSGAPQGDSTTPPGDSSGGDSGPLACPPSSTSSFIPILASSRIPSMWSGFCSRKLRTICSAACVSPSANKLFAVTTATGKRSRLAATFAAFSASAVRPTDLHRTTSAFQLAGSAGFRATAC